MAFLGGEHTREDQIKELDDAEGKILSLYYRSVCSYLFFCWNRNTGSYVGDRSAMMLH